MTLEVVPRVDPSLIPALLQLEFEASAPLYEFVYADEARARAAQRALFDAEASEWAPPRGRFAIRDGELLGLVGGVPANELERVRLSVSLALGRAGILSDEGTVQRMGLALEGLAVPEQDDYYCGVIAVAPAARGSGGGPAILAILKQEARAHGARRIVGQMLADSERLMAFYVRHGYKATRTGSVTDPNTGRELRYIHIAKELEDA